MKVFAVLTAGSKLSALYHYQQLMFMLIMIIRKSLSER